MMPRWRRWKTSELKQAYSEINEELARRNSRPDAIPFKFNARVSRRLQFMAHITSGEEFSNIQHLSEKLFEAARDTEELEKLVHRSSDSHDR